MDNKGNVIILILSFPLISFMLQPISSYANSENIDAELNLNGVWYGMFIDNNVSDFASRNISFHIINCDSQSGTFDGNAEIDNGDGGEFHFTGAINYDTMDFSLSEDGALENPDDLSFKTFTGIVSDDWRRISGIVNSDRYAIFSVEKVPVENDTDVENSTETEVSAQSEESEETELSQDDEVMQQLEILQSELDDSQNENETLRSELEDAKKENEKQQSELDKVKSENEMLRKILKENEIEYD